jgi:outer membrane protein TolC
VKQEVGKLSETMQNFRERLVRLEVAREADRAQMAAQIAQFKTEVERAELKLTRLLSSSADTPAQKDEEGE